MKAKKSRSQLPCFCTAFKAFESLPMNQKKQPLSGLHVIWKSGFLPLMTMWIGWRGF
jgi:hypothetical protein